MWRRFRWGSAKEAVIMNTIIERLSQIEERSVAAAAEGTEKKKELTMRSCPKEKNKIKTRKDI